MTNIGEQAKPPFAVLPDPSSLFLNRAKRLAALAPGHELGTYLDFLRRITEAQHAIVDDLPPVSLPSPENIARALGHGMPPLSRASAEPDAAMLSAVGQLVARLGEDSMPVASAAAVSALRGMSPAETRERILEVLKDASPREDLAQRVFILAGLQVHFARAASLLNAKDLKPVANATCPSCGSLAMASSVVGWPKAYNTRYCTCSLCSTMWNVVRVTCVLCGSPEGISFRSIEGQPETVKAETCDVCRGYVKVVYQVNNVALEPLCDDVATLGLDMLLAEEGWKRGGHNPFLLGY